MKIFFRLFLILIVLTPSLISTLSPEALRAGASLFKFVPSSDYFYSIATPHALEECIDFGVVFVSALLCSALIVSAAPTRAAIRSARAKRPVKLRDRLVFVAIALLAAYPWIAPGEVVNDYSGASIGLVSRLIDTNLLARGLFLALLLLMAVFSILGLLFVVMGVNENER